MAKSLIIHERGVVLPPVPQACCFPNQQCLDRMPTQCWQAGGIAQGPGTECVSTVCPEGCDCNCSNAHGFGCDPTSGCTSQCCPCHCGPVRHLSFEIHYGATTCGVPANDTFIDTGTAQAFYPGVAPGCVWEGDSHHNAGLGNHYTNGVLTIPNMGIYFQCLCLGAKEHVTVAGFNSTCHGEPPCNQPDPDTPQCPVWGVNIAMYAPPPNDFAPISGHSFVQYSDSDCPHSKGGSEWRHLTSSTSAGPVFITECWPFCPPTGPNPNEFSVS